MSATVEPGFFDTTDRRADGLHRPEKVLTMDWGNVGDLEPEAAEEFTRRRDAVRPLDVMPAPATEKLAGRVVEAHRPGTLSLVVCNTVDAARAVFEALPSPRVLLTSRFRGEDRAAAEQALYEFEVRRGVAEAPAVPDHPGLVCVSTQVIEAGIDVSAHRLWSELAPWSSVIQRLGRLNRDGRDPGARATFWPPVDGKAGGELVGPYPKKDVQTAEKLIAGFALLSQDLPASQALARLAEGPEGDLSREALTVAPTSMPRAFDVHGLFSTDPDLHGGFTDVSAFVRGGDPDADVTVLWRDWIDDRELSGMLGGAAVEPLAEGCPVRAGALRSFLGQAEARAWLWDDDRARWKKVNAQQITPGMVVMLPARVGGYDQSRGWTGDSNDRPHDVPPPGPGRGFADERRSEPGYWSGLEHHLVDAEHRATKLVASLELPDDLSKAVVSAARWHDLGKAHPHWQDGLPALDWLGPGAAATLRSTTGGGALAKTPVVLRAEGTSAGVGSVGGRLAELAEIEARPLGQREADGHVEAAWLVDHRLTRPRLDSLRELPGVTKAAHVPLRPGLRHEAATALAMWARYRAGDAEWPALAVYLAFAHHGKVRTTMRARSETGDDVCGVPRASDPLTVAGDDWPMDFSVATDGADGEWTDDGFELTGHGWTGLVADLLGPWRGDDAERWRTGAVGGTEPRALGPFRLAYLEALVRIADWRASAEPSHSVTVAETPT